MYYQFLLYPISWTPRNMRRGGKYFLTTETEILKKLSRLNAAICRAIYESKNLHTTAAIVNQKKYYISRLDELRKKQSNNNI